MNKGKIKAERVERALRAAWREGERAAAAEGQALSERTMGRILLRVRATARSSREAATGDVRFLWRFLSAGAVAAGVLVAVVLTTSPQESLALNAPADDVNFTVMNPTLPF